MKKVIYLNYDLSKQEDQLCYNFLMSLGRSKKSFINTVLMSTHLPQQYAIPNMYAGKVQEKAECKKADTTQNKIVSSETKRNMMHEEALQIAKPKEADIREFDMFDISNREKTYGMFTTEQLQRIKEKGLDLDALTESQKEAMAKMMEDYVPVATAYSLAGFEK